MALQVTRWLTALGAITAILLAGRCASRLAGLRAHAVTGVALLLLVLGLGVVILLTHHLAVVGVAYSVATVALLFHQVLFAARGGLLTVGRATARPLYPVFGR